MQNGNGKALGSSASRECYDTKEVAAKLGISYGVLINWINDPKRRKQLPPFKTFGGAVKFGATYVFPIKKFHEWMENN